jgi:putative oxidoreductase
MKRAGKIARLTLGLLLIIFGIHGFTGIMGERILPYEALSALECLSAMGYVIPFLSGLAVVSGALLLGNILVPVVIAVATTLVTAVLLFHLMLHPRGMLFALIAMVAAILVIIDHKDVFAAILFDHRTDE